MSDLIRQQEAERDAKKADLIGAMRVVQRECRMHEHCGDCPVEHYCNWGRGLPCDWMLPEEVRHE